MYTEATLLIIAFIKGAEIIACMRRCLNESQNRNMSDGSTHLKQTSWKNSKAASLIRQATAKVRSTTSIGARVVLVRLQTRVVVIRCKTLVVDMHRVETNMSSSTLPLGVRGICSDQAANRLAVGGTFVAVSGNSAHPATSRNRKGGTNGLSFQLRGGMQRRCEGKVLCRCIAQEYGKKNGGAENMRHCHGVQRIRG